LLPQAKPPSLRIHPARTWPLLEHLNLHPVQAKSVPTFCLKVRFANTRQGGERGAPAVVKIGFLIDLMVTK